MNARERVLAAFGHREPDRVPIDYAANGGIDGRLKEHFGLDPGDDEGLRRALHVDFRAIVPPHIGPKLHADLPDRGIRVDEWGVHRRWVEHGTGGYWDFCDFPLREADEEAVAAWPMPSPDHFDYASVSAQCKRYGGFALHAGDPGYGDTLNNAGMLRGVEQSLVDLITADPAGALLVRRRAEIQLEILRRTLDAGAGAIDFLWLGEDLGTQGGPLISLDLYRKAMRPLHQRFVDLARSFGIPVMMHSCGSSAFAFEDFIEMGIGIVDTIQPDAKEMEPERLKARFGGRLAFHGGIGTSGPVATGTAEETVADCRRTLEIMMPGGGYCFAPSHQLQDNSPTENVVAMYETALRFGVY